MSFIPAFIVKCESVFALTKCLEDLAAFKKHSNSVLHVCFVIKLLEQNQEYSVKWNCKIWYRIITGDVGTVIIEHFREISVHL